MTSTHGMNNIIIGDSDGLIALIYQKDNHHQTAYDIVVKIYEQGLTLLFPVVTIAETITTFTRKLNNPDAASKLTNQILEGPLKMVDTTDAIMKEAAKLFNPNKSKQNTFFDAVVAATAKEYRAHSIFSFDNWYGKQGFKLAKDLLL